MDGVGEETPGDGKGQCLGGLAGGRPESWPEERDIVGCNCTMWENVE